MDKMLVYLTLFVIGSQAYHVFNPFENDQSDDHFIKKSLPSFPDVAGEEPTSGVPPITLQPFKGLNILEKLMIDLERKRAERRKKIEAWIMGNSKRSPIGMLSADANGLQCSTCSSHNLADCARNAKTKQCDSSKQCYTVHLQHKESEQNSVIKGCIDKTKCEDDVCKKIQFSSNNAYKSCKMECCKGEMCNKLKAPKPLPKLPGPTGPKCFSCQAFDEASCADKGNEITCKDNEQCASVFVVQKTNGKGILAKGCIPKPTCDAGLCKSLLSQGYYSSCKGSCCLGNSCNGVNVTAPVPSTEPITTGPTVSTATPRIKCLWCLGNNQSTCDNNMSVKQCDVDERCYSGGATLKVPGGEQGRSTFGRGCTKQTKEQCKVYCKRFESRLANCSYNCCDGNLCNKPGSVVTQPPTLKPTVTDTQRPVTGPQGGLWCTHCKSEISEADCESRRELNQCDSGRVCYFGRAVYHSGEKMVFKGCMHPEGCKTACGRLGDAARYCNVTCCTTNDCNRQIVTPTPTNIPVKNPNIRALLKLIDAFKVLLEAIENSIRVSAVDYKASDYKDQISSMMTKMSSHAQLVKSKKSPIVKSARQQLIALQKRASEVLESLEEAP